MQLRPYESLARLRVKNLSLSAIFLPGPSVAIGDNHPLNTLIRPAATKSLAAMPRKDRDAMVAKIEKFAVAPQAAHGWAKPLVGMAGAVRLRHGDWRAICFVDAASNTLIVATVGHHKEIYR